MYHVDTLTYSVYGTSIVVTFVIPSRPELFLIIYSFEIISIIKLKNGIMDLLVRFICLVQGWGNIGLKRSVPLGILHLSLHTPLLWYCWLSTREIKKTFWLHTRHQELGSLEKDYLKKIYNPMWLKMKNEIFLTITSLFLLSWQKPLKMSCIYIYM